MNFENYTLLVVDDNKENRDILSRRLESAGFKTIKAKDGQHAIDVLNETKVHLMLLDIMMPEIDGMTVLLQIRKDKRFDEMPVIMLTAINVTTVAEECLRNGACGYVTKPYDMDIIKQKIQKCLEMSSTTDKN